MPKAKQWGFPGPERKAKGKPPAFRKTEGTHRLGLGLKDGEVSSQGPSGRLRTSAIRGAQTIRGAEGLPLALTVPKFGGVANRRTTGIEPAHDGATNHYLTSW